MIETCVGYTGGQFPNPTYRKMGDHTESVRIKFDPKKTSYQKLLDKFWREHSPQYKTSTQYKSAIWYHSEEQRKLAVESRREIEKKLNCKVATVIESMESTKFYLAEDYHQKYYKKNGCRIW